MDTTTSGVYLSRIVGLSPILSEPACLQVISSRSRSRRSLAPGVLGFSVGCSWAQPERDMYGLHRLLHHGQHLPAQLIQVNFLAQGGAESGERLGCIVLATVETSVKDGL